MSASGGVCFQGCLVQGVSASGGCLLLGVSALGGVCSGGVCLEGVSASGGTSAPGGLLLGGVCFWGGVCSGGGMVSAPRGVSALEGGGVCSRGVYLVLGGVPGQVLPPVGRHTPVNILPCPKLRLGLVKKSLADVGVVVKRTEGHQGTGVRGSLL